MDAVGGLTLGADPIACAVSYASASSGAPVRAFTVRKEPKTHGTGKLIEGAFQAGDRVVVIEDTITTGSSARKAVEAVRAGRRHGRGGTRAGGPRGGRTRSARSRGPRGRLTDARRGDRSVDPRVGDAVGDHCNTFRSYAAPHDGLSGRSWRSSSRCGATSAWRKCWIIPSPS